MKQLTLIAITLTLLCANVVTKAQELEKHGRQYTYTKTHTQSTQGARTLIIRNTRGDVLIKGWSEDRIEVEQTLYMDVYTEEEAREAVDKLTRQVKLEGSQLILGSDDVPRRGINSRYIIHAPARLAAQIELEGGEIEVLNMNGKLKAATAGGEISIWDMGSDVDVSTGGGEIEVGNIQGDLYVQTGGGEITVSSVSGDANINTGAGDVSVENVAGKLILFTGVGEVDVNNVQLGSEIRSGGGEMTLASCNGDVMVQSGGGEVTLSDIQGNARIATGGGSLDGRRLTGKMSMSTGGGDVDLSEVKAALEVATGGGDICVELTMSDFNIEYPVTLGSGAGDIELTLPESMPASLEASIKFRGRAWEEYEIDANFPLSTDNEQEGRYRVLTGTARLNGGGSLIKLKTRNGNIYIKQQ